MRTERGLRRTCVGLFSFVICGWPCVAAAIQADVGVQPFLSPTISSANQVPADADLAVGPNHVVVISNEGIKVYLKSGFSQSATPVASWPLYDETSRGGGFWDELGAVLPYDPEVVYDPFHDRFWVMAIEYFPAVPTQLYFDIAVSEGSDPSGAWTKYRLDAKQWAGGYLSWEGATIDSPNMAVDADWLYLNAWCHRNPQLDVKSPIWILDVDGPLSGVPKNQLTKLFTPMPDPEDGFYNRKGIAALVQKFDVADTSPQYLIGLDPDYPVGQVPGHPTGFDEITVHAVLFDRDGQPYVESLIMPPDNRVLYYAPANSAPQPPPAFLVRFLKLTSARFWATPVFRGGNLWAVHHVRESSASCRNVVHWYKIGMNAWPLGPDQPVILDSGAIRPADADAHAYYPSIGVNGLGHALITYNQSGDDSGEYISIWRTIIVSGSTATVAIKNDLDLGRYWPYDLSEQICGSSELTVRWGDYSGTESDPSDDCIFWSHHSWAGLGVGNKWRTWLARSIPPQACITFGGDGPESGGRSADLNQDGTVDLLDYLEFQRLFQMRELRADFTTDGVLDIFDFLEFQTAFESSR